MKHYPASQTRVFAGLIVITVILLLFDLEMGIPLVFFLVLAGRHVITTKIQVTVKTYVGAFIVFCCILVAAFWSHSCTLQLGDNRGILAGIGTGMLFVALRYRDITLFFDEQFLRSPPAIPSSVIVRSIAGVAGAAVFQEIFFRGYLMCAFSDYGLYSIVIASILFCLDHFLMWRSQKAYTGKDYIYFFLLSCALGIIYYFTGSLIGCIVGHAVVNSPRIVWLVLKYRYQSEQ
jgi:membrane protease YdiL (CAAX protease family)